MTRIVTIILTLFTLTFSSISLAANPRVLLTTSKGNIELELDIEKAPISVDNFISYVNSGFYRNTIFHRVIPGFMIQAGGFTHTMEQKKTNLPIRNEADNELKNKKWTISMARTSDVNSATSQFFINVEDNDFLDYSSPNFGYAVFGRVVSGINVIKAIELVDTNAVGLHQNVPINPIIILSAAVLNE